jgi:hypothetical protein
MRIQVISDVHFEMFKMSTDFEVFYERLTGGGKKNETILCIAGDMGLFHAPDTWIKPLRFLSTLYKAIVCIAGTREYYGNDFLGQEKLLKTDQLPQNIHYLFNDTLIIDDIHFIGGTLWTSFFDRDHVAMEYAKKNLSEFKGITTSDGSTLTPSQAVDLHDICKSYIFHQVGVARSNNKKSVVISHHGISRKSDHPYISGFYTPAFYTDLTEDIIIDGPDIWIHGRTHHSVDYVLGGTRVVCNPFGYFWPKPNTNFNYQLDLSL